jgi:large subunit ribosomal protein L9
MKLILREHVDHLGERGQIVSVKPGYARNFLIPKGLAYAATPGNREMVEHQRRTWVQRDAQELQQAEAMRGALEGVALSVKKKAGDSGTLYGSVTKSEIAELLAAKGFRVDRRTIGPDAPIKTVGEFPVTVKLHRSVKASLTLTVEAENPPSPALEPADEPADDDDADERDE